MTETKRTAAQIRAYMAKDMQLHKFLYLIEEDMPRVLDAADDSWGMVAHLYHAGATADMDPETVAEVERILDEYAWLADSPEAPVSPDGESGEEGET